MLLGLTFLLHDDGGLVLSKDHIQIYKGAILTPNHPFPLVSEIVPSESLEKRGGTNIKNRNCPHKGECKIQDQGKIAILLNKEKIKNNDNTEFENYDDAMIICLEDYEINEGIKPEVLYKTLLTIEIDEIISLLKKLGIIGEDPQKYWYIDKPVCHLKIKKDG